VNKSQPPTSIGHPEELLLPYAENSLSRSEVHLLEQHLAGCPECTDTVERLRQTTSSLRAHREAFCPEPWELYEFAFHGEDPDGSVQTHLQRCRSCRATFEAWSSEHQSVELPNHLWVQIRNRFGKRESQPTEPEPLSSKLRTRLFKRLMFSSVAVGAAAAAILVVVLLVPREIPQSTIVTSSISWEQAPKPKGVSGSRSRIAVIIALRGFPNRWSQKEVDSLYQSIAPDMDQSQRFDMLSPQLVSEALQEEAGRLRSTEDVTSILRQNLSVDQALSVTVSQTRNGMAVSVDLKDAQSHETIKQAHAERIVPKYLETRIRKLVSEVLDWDGG
jgi:anti-sigma factor RsiW